RANGFAIEALIELRPPEGGTTTYGGYVTYEWARQWAAEHLWVARKAWASATSKPGRGRIRITPTPAPRRHGARTRSTGGSGPCPSRKSTPFRTCPGKKWWNSAAAPPTSAPG